MQLIPLVIALAGTACTHSTTRCAEPVISVPPGYVMTDYDHKVLRGAKLKCGFLYPKSPCVTKFEIVKPRQYRVTCGVTSD